MFYDKSMLGADHSASCAPMDAVQALSGLDARIFDNDNKALPEPPKGTRGLWLDEAVDFRDPKGDAFVRHVLDLVAPFDLLKIKRSPVKAENHHLRIRKILANGLRCFYHRDPGLVSFQRRAGRFQGKPAWFTGTGMRTATDLLKRAGLIDLTVGAQCTGTASTYTFGERLLFAALDCGISERSLTYHLAQQRLVRLYETNRDGAYLDFPPTDETQRWTGLLEAYNAFLRQQEIDLTLSSGEEGRIVDRWNSKLRDDLPRHRKPEMIQTDLYRQFNNGSFEQGGRLYGGWWIGIPSDLRPRITINGQPTVELDYSGCAIRMLYHERGVECPDDPYFLAEIAALENRKGYAAGHFRDAIKSLTQALINGGDRDKDMMCELPDGLSFSPQFTRAQVMGMIAAKHRPIANAFGSGAGIRLQRKDSDLALAITTNLMAQGIVALPVHDSFIVETEHRTHLFDEMNNQYRRMFGFNPIIK